MRIRPFLLLAGLVACRGVESPRPDSVAADEAAVRVVLLRSAECFNRKDADGYLALYAPDAVLVNVRGRRWRLPEDRPLVHEVFRTALRAAVMETGDIDVLFLRPDVAVARVEMTVGPFVLDDGSQRPPERQIGLSVLTKERARWWIRTFQNTAVADSSPRPSPAGVPPGPDQ